MRNMPRSTRLVAAATAIVLAYGSMAFANGFQGYVAFLDPVLQKHIQVALRDKGFDPGPIDGNFGRRSEAALKDFRKAHNILRNDDIDGVLTPRLAKELLGIDLVEGSDGEDLSLDEQLDVLEKLGLVKSKDYWKNHVFP